MLETYITNIIRSFITGLRILLFAIGKKKRFGARKHDHLIVLGNGPSLTHVIDKLSNGKRSVDFMAVNYFCLSDDYEKIKPLHYVINAPEHLWHPPESIKPEILQSRSLLFNTLREKTTWNLYLFIPYFALKAKWWQKIITTNTNISVIPYHSFPAEGYKWLRHLLYRHGLGMPRPHNVIIPSLILGINLRYRKIYLSGTEHSWLKTIYVDKDNKVWLDHSHFYDKEKQINVMHKDGGVDRKLHEILHKFMISFEGYWLVKEYAEERNVEIINLTKDSYIDAFIRQNIESWILN